MTSDSRKKILSNFNFLPNNEFPILFHGIRVNINISFTKNYQKYNLIKNIRVKISEKETVHHGSTWLRLFR